MDEESLNNEISILKSCDHPNIAKLYEIFHDDSHLFLIQELCDGGSVDDYLTQRRFDEEKAKNVFYQMLYAVNY